jgi:two-component system, chemotaxis family, sensor kinase Cph1
MIHEIQVHQIELEMQNHELRRTQVELEESRDKHQSLYDFSPVGYFPLTHEGIVTDSNQTGAVLLAMPRPKLIGRGFACFVAPECHDIWHKHIISVVKQEEK